MANYYAEALLKAKKYEMMSEGANTGDTEFVASALLESNVGKKIGEAKEKVVNGATDAAKDAGKKLSGAKDAVVSAIKNHPKTAGAAVGTAAAIGAGVAAKKIYDKKKAAKAAQQKVQENCEYPEYQTVIECVVNNLMSEEEIMSENATQIATDTANYLIDNVDKF